MTGELAGLAGLAEAAAKDAGRLLVNAKRALRRARTKVAHLAACGQRDPAAGRRRGRLVRAVNDLAELLDTTRQIAAQARQRVAGVMPGGATRRVSLHDPDGQPIAKGRLGKPVEFAPQGPGRGQRRRHRARPLRRTGQPRRRPATRARGRAGHPPHRHKPRTVTADRGYGDKRVDDALHALGVRSVVIPRKGKPGKARQAEEHRRAFRRTVKWRTGSEGRISTLKRGYGWDRTRIDTTEGARIWGRPRHPGTQPGQDQHPGSVKSADRDSAATRSDRTRNGRSMLTQAWAFSCRSGLHRPHVDQRALQVFEHLAQHFEQVRA